MKKKGETEGVFGGDKELNLALKKKNEMGILKNLHPVVNKFYFKIIPVYQLDKGKSSKNSR